MPMNETTEGMADVSREPDTGVDHGAVDPQITLLIPDRDTVEPVLSIIIPVKSDSCWINS